MILGETDRHSNPPCAEGKTMTHTRELMIMSSRGVGSGVGRKAAGDKV
jgi:hypothetical protein